MTARDSQSGFTLVEIAIVLLIVAILLGYTVALFPQQQQLKQYRALNMEMDRIIEAVIGFAQVNGRLPCPAIPSSVGIEVFNYVDGCANYGGFVPANTLGLDGRLNADSLLIDPWGNPYRYYVSDRDFNGNGLSDFVWPGEMRLVGLVDSDGDYYIDLDGRYLICDGAGTTTNNKCTGATTVFGTYLDNGDADDDRYAGAPFVLLSMGKNWTDTPVGDELENSGNSLTKDDLSMTDGPSGAQYVLKDVGSPAYQTTFVRRPGGLADDFDDVVRWVSPNILFSRMIQAGQLP